MHSPFSWGYYFLTEFYKAIRDVTSFLIEIFSWSLLFILPSDTDQFRKESGKTHSWILSISYICSAFGYRSEVPETVWLAMDDLLIAYE